MADTTVTRAQLVRMAGKFLQLSDSANAMSDQDFDTIDESVDGFLNILAQRGVVHVANDEEIPSEHAELIAKLLGNHVASAFGKPEANVEMIEAQLRMITSSGPTYEVLKTEYF